MIIVSKIHPSGALEVSAMVRDLRLYGVYLERQTYYGYSKQEARKQFIIHLNANHLALVNG